MARLQDFQNVTPTSSDKILIVQSQGQGLAPHTIKLDSANPTGTGSLSLNRKANTTVGNYSVATGYNNEATGVVSRASGEGTKATGRGAIAEAINSQATGDYSISQGYGTIANHQNQVAFGQYNVADTSTAASTLRGNYIEIVGKGTNDANRSNARTLDWSGNEVLAGGLKVNGSNQVYGTAVLESVSANSEKTYTIPASIYSDSGIYLLAIGNTAGAGVVYLLKVAGASSRSFLVGLATTSYFTVDSISNTQFKVTAGGAIGTPCLTRIA